MSLYLRPSHPSLHVPPFPISLTDIPVTPFLSQCLPLPTFISSFLLLDPFTFPSLSCMRSSDALCCGSHSRQLSVYHKTARQKDFMSCERQLFPNRDADTVLYTGTEPTERILRDG